MFGCFVPSQLLSFVFLRIFVKSDIGTPRLDVEWNSDGTVFDEP
jgi:hypothetical protein